MSVLILGIGNILRKDDGIGVHAARLLQQETWTGADVLELGTSVQDCFSLLERYRHLVVLDAVVMGLPPGTFRWLSESQIRHEGKVLFSPHDLDLFEALDLAGLRGRRPTLHVAGMEPEDYACWGMECSACVQEMLPGYLAMVRDKVRRLIRADDGSSVRKAMERLFP